MIVCGLCLMVLTETTTNKLVCCCCSPLVWSMSKMAEDGPCSHMKRVYQWEKSQMVKVKV